MDCGVRLRGFGQCRLERDASSFARHASLIEDLLQRCVVARQKGERLGLLRRKYEARRHVAAGVLDDGGDPAE